MANQAPDWYQEASLKVQAVNLNNGRPNYLAFNPNRYNKVSGSMRANEGWLNFDVDIDDFFALLEMIESATHAPTDSKSEPEGIAILKNGQEFGGIYVVTNDDGEVFLLLQNANVGKEMLTFQNRKRYVYRNGGNPMPPSRISVLRARGFVKLARQMVAEDWKQGYTPKERDNNAPSGGGYNKQYGNGGGQPPQQQYQSAPPAAGDIDSFLP